METKIITADENAVRADVFLSEKTGFTRSRIKKLLDGGFAVRENGVKLKPRDALKAGEKITLNVPAAETYDVKPVDIPVKIVYEDGDIAVIDKPQGLTVHAGNGTGDNTLVNALLFKLDSLSGINGVIRPGIVHRIDKDTTGLLVVAKNDAAHLSLAKQIAEKTCKREYLALLTGNLKTDKGVIDTFIGRSEKARTLMTVTDGKGRRAVTEYEVIERFGKYTFCKFNLKTGRTHQIRVHAKYLGHPVVGDKTYGVKDDFDLKGQLLHAYKLTLKHPVSDCTLTFFAPLPEHFVKVLKKLKSKTVGEYSV